MPLDLFLSHSAADDVFAERLASAFTGGQVSCWLDHRAIHPGENWDQEIHRALFSCRAGCFLLTPNSESSDECHAEWRSVLQQKKRLYVAVFGEPRNFPYRLRLIQYVDLSTDFEGGLEILVGAVRTDNSVGRVADAFGRPETVGTLLPLNRRIVRSVRLVLDMAVETFKGIASAFVRGVARLLGVPDNDIGLLGFSAGSTVVDLSMSEEAARLLVEVFRTEPNSLGEFGVRSIDILPQSGAPSSLSTAIPEPSAEQVELAMGQMLAAHDIGAFSQSLRPLFENVLQRTTPDPVVTQALFTTLMRNKSLNRLDLLRLLAGIDPSLRSLFDKFRR